MRKLRCLCFCIVALSVSVTAQQFVIDKKDFDAVSRKFCGIHQQAKLKAHRDRLVTEFRHEPAQAIDIALIETLETDAAGSAHFAAQLMRPNERIEMESIRTGGYYFKRIGNSRWIADHKSMSVERWAMEKRSAIFALRDRRWMCDGKATYQLNVADFRGRTAYVYSRIIRKEMRDSQTVEPIVLEAVNSYWLSTEGAPVRSQSLYIETRPLGVTLRTLTFEHEWDQSIQIGPPVLATPFDMFELTGKSSRVRAVN